MAAGFTGSICVGPFTPVIHKIPGGKTLVLHVAFLAFSYVY